MAVGVNLKCHTNETMWMTNAVLFLSVVISLPSSHAKLEQAFLVQLPGCTGSLISDNWIITASHCYNSLEYVGFSNDQGDLEVDLRDQNLEYSFVEKPDVLKEIPTEGFWTRPFKQEFQLNDTVGLGGATWRKVKRAILHRGFESESLSWRGFDIALVELEPGSFFHKSNEDGIVPVCLSSREVEPSEQVEIAGYGRRYVPHCMTDESGPEKYAVCGRPKDCSREHKTQYCGLDFLYNGTQHHKCIQGETPSASNQVCQTLWALFPGSFRRTSFVFNNDQNTLNVTCYPKIPPKGSKGWCSTRNPGIHADAEPDIDSGWGFCSPDKRQDYCNEPIPSKIDSQATTVSVFDADKCVYEMGQNLKIEQPSVQPEEYRDLQRANLFCVGINHTNELDESIYRLNLDGRLSKISRDSVRAQLQAKLTETGDIQTHFLEGGPGCFGDSGGPAFRVMTDPVTNRKVPVLMGVFSFMLWGTCGSREEPSYYGHLRARSGGQSSHSWIRRQAARRSWSKCLTEHFIHHWAVATRRGTGIHSPGAHFHFGRPRWDHVLKLIVPRAQMALFGSPLIGIHQVIVIVCIASG
ncbi:hypothetical protein TCAL_17094 [Tigriopus californicus]|uniref:Peptidase S1 domain-containing protein n=1 Tax=Tigriopus californicus TaxID=6832 RepID=A0A553PQY7_TIGCA|nr:hypothetical protein TCAL_17094 [Tigriopus californicus]